MRLKLQLWYFFGVISMMLANQILTGIWLTMNYVPSQEGALLPLNTSCVT